MRALEERNLTTEQFITICNSNNILDAMIILKMHRSTFTKYAKLLNCYNPNYGGKGKSRHNSLVKFNISDWNNDKLINIARVSMRRWIFRLKLFPIKCNSCNLEKWLDKEIPLELNHINGNGHENRKSNLELLCPNCHALTDTYRGKNHTKINNNIEIKREEKKLFNRKKNWNKWKTKNIPTSKSREEYHKERKEILFNKNKDLIKMVESSNIDFSKKGWRLEVAKIINKTPQYSFKFLENYLPHLLEKCYKHKN